MLSELSQLKNIVAEVVALKTKGLEPVASMQPELQALAGYWYNTENGSNIYSRVVRGELVSPYCCSGNTKLTGVYEESDVAHKH